jgi:hypothetical protein
MTTGKKIIDERLNSKQLHNAFCLNCRDAQYWFDSEDLWSILIKLVNSFIDVIIPLHDRLWNHISIVSELK